MFPGQKSASLDELLGRLLLASQRIDPISRRLVADSHGPQSACDGGTIDAIPVPEPLKAFVRQLGRFMIAFGEPMWSFTSPLVGRTGGPEKFHSSTAKRLFQQYRHLADIGVLPNERKRLDSKQTVFREE